MLSSFIEGIGEPSVTCSLQTLVHIKKSSKMPISASSHYRLIKRKMLGKWLKSTRRGFRSFMGWM